MSDLLEPHGDPRRRLRELLANDQPAVAPGAYDALSGRLVEEAGFPAVYMTGFGATASLIGRPDVGLLTQTEMVDNARRIAQSVGVPVVSDADTGYGNAINVVRTVRDFEQAGVAGIHLEDQLAPKKCGHVAGKEVVPTDEMVSKLRAAVDARGDPNFVIIARTDARAVEGLSAALERARAYREAGADVLFVEAPETDGEIETVATTFPDVPLVFNWAEGGKTPAVSLGRLTELGFRLVLFPVGTLLAATGGMRELLRLVGEDGTPSRQLERLPDFGDFLDFIGMAEIRDMEQRFQV